jgi:hypothetical protein
MVQRQRASTRLDLLGERTQHERVDPKRITLAGQPAGKRI